MSFCCPKAIRAAAIRITELDACGNVLDPTQNVNTQISTDAFVSLSLSPDIEDGETFRKKLANGNICINDNEDCDKLLGFEAELMVCDVPSHMVELMMGGSTLVNANGDVKGMVLPDTNFSGICPPKFTVEVWSENADKDDCADGQDNRYIRWVLPKVFKAQLTTDLTFENDMLEFGISFYVEANSNFTSPVGANDPDFTAEHIAAIQAGGPLAWICTGNLPEIVECDFTNSQ